MTKQEPKRGLGRMILLGAIGLFGVCAVVTFAAYLLDDSEPSADMAARSAATIEVLEATQVPTVPPPTEVAPFYAASSTATVAPPTPTSFPTVTTQLVADNLEITAVNEAGEFV